MMTAERPRDPRDPRHPDDCPDCGSSPSPVPDFNALALSSPWTAREWHDAWTEVTDPAAWPLVVELCEGNLQHPVYNAGLITWALA